MAEQYMYKYVLSNGRFYVGRDKVNEYLRAKDHLQNALSVVDKAFYPEDYVIYPGKITFKGFQLMDKPQHFENDWGQLICSNKKSAQQILLPFHNNLDIMQDYEHLKSVLEMTINAFGDTKRRIFDNSMASFYKVKTRDFFIQQLQESLGTDDDLIRIMRSAQTKEKRGKTAKQNEYIRTLQQFSNDNNFVLSPSAYQIVTWSAVPITLWKNAPCFQLDRETIEILQQAGCKYKQHDVTTLYELLLISNSSLFNNDETDVIESLLTMQAYSVNPSQMANVNFGNKEIKDGINIKFNNTVIGTKKSNADDAEVTVDLNQLGVSLLQGMPLDKKDARFTQEQLDKVKKLVNASYKGTKNILPDGTLQLWDTSNPAAVKAIANLARRNKNKIQEVRQVDVKKAIDIEQNKILVLDLADALGLGDFQEGMAVLRELILRAINKFFSDSAGIEKIWQSFAKQKEMLKYTLSEIYYDTQSYTK